MDCARIADDQTMERYLTRQLDDAEREAFEQHFFECDDCFDQLEALQAAQKVLAAETVSQAQQIKHPRRLRTWGWAVAAAAVVVFGLVAMLRLAMQPPGPGTASLSPDLAQLARIEAPSYEPVRLRGATDEAQQRFRTAMKLYSTDDYVSAIPGLEEVAKLDPNAPNISFFLGACYLLTGRDSDGINTLQHTVALGDTVFLEEAHLLLAKVHIHRGEFDVARIELKSVIDLGGDFASEARALLAELSREVPALK